jgi:hypothetical protein
MIISISVSGTRLPITKTDLSIKNVSVAVRDPRIDSFHRKDDCSKRNLGAVSKVL